MNFKLTIATSLAFFLAACGGGSGGTTTATPAPTAAATTYTPNAPQTGDTYNYSETTTYSDGTTAQTPYTDQVAIVASNGDFYLNERNSTTGAILSTYDLDANRNYLSTSPQCTYSPTLSNALPIPSYVGETINSNSTYTCPPNGEVINITRSINVIDYEAITVTAGTFNTLKTQIVTSNSNGPGATYLISPNTKTLTCWFDIVTGFAVQCQTSISYNPALPTSVVTVASYSSQLTSKSNATNTAVALTGFGLDGSPLPFLYVTPNEQSGMENAPNSELNALLDTTAPVTWSLVTGTNTQTISGGTNTINYDGASFTVSPTPTSLIITAPDNVTSIVQAQLIATLTSNPSQKMTINLILNPPSGS